MTKMCNDCKWVGSGWFIIVKEYRNCYHPLVIKDHCARHPAGDGFQMVGLERTYGSVCGSEGKMWNRDENGN